MEGLSIGRNELMLMAAIKALGPKAYGVTIMEYVGRVNASTLAMGNGYAALHRLVTKGLASTRKDRRRRMYRLTNAGQMILKKQEEAKDGAVAG
jgi:DNA-binding PadR family transcriptional regulator